MSLAGVAVLTGCGGGDDDSPVAACRDALNTRYDNAIDSLDDARTFADVTQKFQQTLGGGDPEACNAVQGQARRALMDEVQQRFADKLKDKLAEQRGQG